MGLMDFLRRKVEELRSKTQKREQESEATEEQKPEIKQRLKFEELENWLGKNKKENQQKEEEIIREINLFVSGLVSDLKEGRNELGKVDLSKRKEEQRIKNIVLENLLNYSAHIENLIKELEKLEKDNLQKLVNSINKIFIEFKQKSNMSFEKATYLVGKEMEIIKGGIRNFFEELKILEEQNKDIFNNSEAFSSAEKKISEIKNQQELGKEISNEIKKLDTGIIIAENEEKNLEAEIKKIRNSEEYILWEKKREESKLKKKEIEKEIFEVKNHIDWKNLSQIFHTNEKKMGIIKEYESHFSQIFEKEGEEKIMAILKEANIDTREISNEIKDIKIKMHGIHEIINTKDKLSEHASRIMIIRADKKNLISEKEKVLKRIQKIDENILNLKKDTNVILGKVGISLEEK